MTVRRADSLQLKSRMERFIPASLLGEMWIIMEAKKVLKRLDLRTAWQ